MTMFMSCPLAVLSSFGASEPGQREGHRPQLGVSRSGEGTHLFSGYTFTEKVLPLPIPLQRERLHQVFQRQMRWVLSI